MPKNRIIISVNPSVGFSTIIQLCPQLERRFEIFFPLENVKENKESFIIIPKGIWSFIGEEHFTPFTKSNYGIVIEKSISGRESNPEREIVQHMLVKLTPSICLGQHDSIALGEIDAYLEDDENEESVEYLPLLFNIGNDLRGGNNNKIQFFHREDSLFFFSKEEQREIEIPKLK